MLCLASFRQTSNGGRSSEFQLRFPSSFRSSLTLSPSVPHPFSRRLWHVRCTTGGARLLSLCLLLRRRHDAAPSFRRSLRPPSRLPSLSRRESPSEASRERETKPRERTDSLHGITSLNAVVGACVSLPERQCCLLLLSISHSRFQTPIRTYRADCLPCIRDPGSSAGLIV